MLPANDEVLVADVASKYVAVICPLAHKSAGAPTRKRNVKKIFSDTRICIKVSAIVMFDKKSIACGIRPSTRSHTDSRFAHPKDVPIWDTRSPWIGAGL